MRPDGGSLPARELHVVSDPSLALLFGEDRGFEVRYSATDATPITGAPVRFALVSSGEGTANDSSLSTLEERTDGEGTVRGILMAGRTPSVFQVEISAERAAPAHIDVSVSDAGFGGLHVNVIRRPGVRPVSRRVISIFADRGCMDAGVFDQDGNRSPLELSGGIDDARFMTLPAGLTYAVVARGLSDSEAIVSWGCSDGIPLVADEETDVDVEMVDLPLVADGRYAVVASWDTADEGASLGRAVRVAGHLVVDGAGGDASLLLDALEQQLRDAGRFGDADGIAGARGAGGMESSLADQLAAADMGPGIAVDRLAAQVETRAAVVQVDGTLTLDSGAPASVATWTLESASTWSGSTDSPRLTMDFTTLGVEPTAMVEARLVAEDDAVDLTVARFELPLGALGIGALAAMATERRVGSTVDLMMDPGCAPFVAWAPAQPLIAAACDGACVLMACRAAMEPAAMGIEAAISDLSSGRSVVRLIGRVDLTDETGDLQVDTLMAPALRGAWRSMDGAEGRPVAATLGGTRIID